MVFQFAKIHIIFHCRKEYFYYYCYWLYYKYISLHFPVLICSISCPTPPPLAYNKRQYRHFFRQDVTAFCRHSPRSIAHHSAMHTFLSFPFARRPLCLWVGAAVGIEYRLYVNAIAGYVKTNSFPWPKSCKYISIRTKKLRDPDAKTT